MGNDVRLYKGIFLLFVMVFMLGEPCLSRTKTVALSEAVTQIVNYTPFSIIYKPGASKIDIDASEKIINGIELKQSGHALTVHYNGDNLSGGEKVVITVGGEDMNSFQLYGSGSITASNLEGVGISLQVYGSGDISVDDIEGSKIRLDLYGSGDIKVGNADCSSLIVVCSGSGDIDLHNADAVVSELIHQGSGNMKVRRIDCTSLKATNNGSGDMKVTGETISAVYIINGSGDIDSSGMKAERVTKIVQGSGIIK